MTERTWYLNCGAEDVGDRAILVGDRGRVARIAARLDDVSWLNEDRGLTTATGRLGDLRITVSAFGMGAPIAAVVLHELHDAGVGVFLRLGHRDGAAAGADGRPGDRRRGDPRARPPPPPTCRRATRRWATTSWARRCARRPAAAGARWHAGLVDSQDGFYPAMLGAAERHRELRRLGVLALDMETSAVLAIGRALGARAASLCVGDGRRAERRPDGRRRARGRRGHARRGRAGGAGGRSTRWRARERSPSATSTPSPTASRASATPRASRSARRAAHARPASRPTGSRSRSARGTAASPRSSASRAPARRSASGRSWRARSPTSTTCWATRAPTSTASCTRWRASATRSCAPTGRSRTTRSCCSRTRASTR